MASHFNFLAFFVMIIFFFLCYLPPSYSVSTRCHPNDYKVLMQIKQSLHNPYHLASWVPNTDCCGWYALECSDTTNRVNVLKIFSGSISGQIPDAVGDLPFLETLLFRKLTNLTGSIPRSVTKLKNLKTLWLSWNSLSGPIPAFLGEIKTLKDLDLSFNQFSGSIPPSLADLPILESLRLDRNRLTGPIPESFGRFAGSLRYLVLSHNQLSGPIPATLGNVDFDTIDLSRNKLEGDASMLFGENKSLRDLDLSRNVLEFDFSKLRFSKTKLAALDLNHNGIYGSIPKQLTEVESLLGFNVSYNRLCGEIPQGGKLQSFDSSTYFHNKCLCGAPLPKCK